MEWQLYPTQILPLKSLEPNTGQIKGVPSNPRYLAEAKAAKLAKSMEQSPEMLGLREILVYPLGKKFVVIGGNMRMQLLKKAGHKDAPCKVIPAETTAEQLKRYVLIDNASFGDWEHEALANSWDDLVQDFCIDVPSFEEAVTEAEIQEHEAEEPSENMQIDVVIGDIIEIGRHRLFCGDSTTVEAVDKVMNGEIPDWIHTDPPYGMNAVSKSNVLSSKYDGDILGDSNNNTAIASFNMVTSIYKNVKQCWWGANYYSEALPSSECWLVWDKNNGGSDQTDAELAWTNYRSVVRMFTKASEKTNRVHPTQKPVSLVAWAFDKSKLVKVNNVLDLFGGSGVTMVWAQQSNINSFLIELDPKYCQVIINRMQKAFPELEVRINGKEYK